jgi:hypothetical protein
MSAINANSIAPTLAARRSPSLAPQVAASSTLTVVFSKRTWTAPAVREVSVSGTRIFAMTNAAGADITDAVSRCLAKNTRWAGSSPPSMAT